MNHLARSKNATEGQSVTDDMVAHPYVGLNLTRFVSPLDSLTIQCGYLLSLERNRGIGTWHHPQGISGDAGRMALYRIKKHILCRRQSTAVLSPVR